MRSVKSKNSAVILATTNASNARINRDKVLYASLAGLYDTAQTVKQYMKSVFDASSPQFKQVSCIKFTTTK